MNESEYILSIILRARNEMAGAFAAATAEASAFRTVIKGLDGDLDSLNGKVSSLTRRLGTLRDRIKDTNSVFKDNQNGIAAAVFSFNQLENSVKNIGGDFNQMRLRVKEATSDVRDHDRAVRESERTHRSWISAIDAAGQGMQKAGLQVKSLGSEMRGLIILGVIGFFQQLTTVALSLGGNLIALGSSAAFAAGALGGGLAAGAAQAIPVLGLLAASVQRLGDVFQALKLRQQALQQNFAQQMQRDARQEKSTNQVANALDGVVSANDRLADSQRGLARAQENVPLAQQNIAIAVDKLREARTEATRQLEDLIAKEREAELTARGASLSVEEAQRNLRDALGSGDSLRIEQARLQLDVSRNAASEARQNLVRTREDNEKAQRLGVDGSSSVQDASRGVDAARRSARDAREAVLDAQRGVADAQRGISQAQRALENARKTNDVAFNNAVTAQRNLEFFLERQLTKSERRLYETLTRISDLYYSVVRDGTDKIIDSFNVVALRVEKLLRDPRIQKAIVDLSTLLGDAISDLGTFLTSPEMVDQFLRITEQAGDNLPLIVGVLKDIISLWGDVAEAAAPALKDILELIGDIVGKWTDFADSTREDGSLGAFFQEGVVHLEAWLQLLGSIINLFMALAGEGGGAASGLRIIQKITDGINGWAEAVRKNSKRVQDFFKDSEEVLDQVWRVIKALAIALFNLFDPDSVEALANILIDVLIPALAQVIEAIGEIVKIAEAVLSVGFIGEIAKWTIVILGFYRAMTVLTGSAGTGLRIFAQMAGTITGLTTFVGGLTAAFAALAGGKGIRGAIDAFKDFRTERGKQKRGGSGGDDDGTGGTTVVGGTGDGDGKKGGRTTTLPNGQTVLVGSPAHKRAQEEARQAEDDRRATAEEERRTRRGGRARTGLKIGAAAVAVGLASGAIPDAAEDRNLGDVGSQAAIVGGQVVNQLQSLISLDLKGWIAQFSGSAGDLKDFANSAEKDLGRAISEHNLKGIEELSKQARDMAKAFPDSAKALSDFADRADKAAKETSDLNKLIKAMGDRADDLKAFKLASDDLADPQAARQFLSNMTRLTQGGITGVEDLRKNMTFNLDQINKGFKDGSASWQEAIALNAGQGIASLRKAMKDGVVATDDGMREINRITRTQMRFARDNVDNLSDEARQRLSTNFQAALDATIEKVGGIEKATGDSLRKIRKLMAAQFELFGLTPEEAGQLARNRTSHDPNRRRLDQNNRPEEGSAFRATGGFIGLPGERGADTELVRVGRGEGIINAVHQAYMQPALESYYGHGVDRMFQRVRGWHGGPEMGGFATGRQGTSMFDGHPGNVNSGVRNLIELMKRLFPLTVTSTTDHSRLTTSGNVSDHTVGAAVDLAGAPEVMLRAADYVKSSGLYKRLKQGIHNPNLAVNAGQLQDPPGQFAGAVWAQHANHLHLAITGAIGKLKGGINANFGEIADQVVKGADKSGQLGLFAQTGVDVVTMAANRMLQRIQESQGDGASAAADIGLASGFDGPWVAVMNKIAAENHWNLSDWRKLVSGESGGRTTARNPSSGAYGLGQFLGSTAQAYAKYGALSSDGADQIRAMAKYIADRYGDPSNAYRTWLGRNPHWYEHGGPLPFERGRAGMFVGHGGEWVVNESQQNKLAQMVGGSVGQIKSALGFTGGPTSFAGGGELSGGGAFDALANVLRDLPGVIAVAVSRAVAPSSELPFQRRQRDAQAQKGVYEFPDIIPISPEGLISEAKRLNTALKNLDQKAKEKFGDYVGRFSKELDDLTGENGLLALLPASIQRRSQIRASRITRDSVGRSGGTLVRTLSPEQITARQIADSEQEARDIRNAQEQFARAQRQAQGQVGAIDDQIGSLRRGGTTTAEKKQIDDLLKKKANLSSQIRSIAEGIRGLDEQLADNVANRYQLQLKQFTDAIAKTDAAQVRQQSNTQFQIRIAKALGRDTGGLEAQLNGQIVNQIQTTEQAVREAMRLGETDLTQQLQAKVEDLYNSLQESAIAAFEASVQAINERASQRSGRIDIAERALSVGLGGSVGGALGLDASSRGAIFAARGASMRQQQGELQERLGVAIAGGNLNAIRELTDQIQDLEVAIAENTIEARNARIEAINSRAQFRTGALGSAVGIVQAIGGRPGQTQNTGVLSQLFQSIGTTLGTQRQGLDSELTGLGFGGGVGDLTTPEGIASFLGRVLPWLETLPEAQRGQAEDLVNSILENTSATIDNTSQLEDLTGANGQSFSSTAWTMFRTAILNGNGRLIPALNGLVPSFQSGGVMPYDGIANLHAGEIITNPALGQSIGDTHFHITTPVEKLDGTTLARETAWARKTQGRM